MAQKWPFWPKAQKWALLRPFLALFKNGPKRVEVKAIFDQNGQKIDQKWPLKIVAVDG